MNAIPDKRPLRLATPPPAGHTTLADELAHALNLDQGDVTVELVYRNRRLARIHIHTHRTITRSRTE